jgi:DNA-directed RNA polymerase subunit RPC12/RpoP
LALRTSCPCCGKAFSAPDEYKGRKIDCPRCGHRFVLKTREELLSEREEDEKRRLKQEDDLRRLELIERQEKRNLERQAGLPYYERYQTGRQPVRNYDPMAPSRFLRMRALSDLLLVGAYASLALSLVGAGVTVYLGVSGAPTSIAVLLLCVIGWILGGFVLFLFLKYLAELAFLLASLGDQQHHVVQLMLDLRENTDPKVSEEV